MAVYLDDGSGTGNMVVIGASLRERFCMSFMSSEANGIESSVRSRR